ncbi:hydrogenase maturation protease [Egbenema bharatensis]|uniref:hydrogenase maturation protease n=1 Tax=Egbenema bharatensis TaxID=3463334 RepID=UPI003A86ECF0
MVLLFSDKPCTSSPILVIGYGNPLRSDDGIGPQIAETLESWHLPQVQTIAVHQLTPELAALLVQFDGVIFVDASLHRNSQTIPQISIEPIQFASFPDSPPSSLIGHLSDPRSLLTLTQALYHQVPQAWWMMVPGVNFEVGDQLSGIGKQNVDIALHQLTHFIQTVRTEEA